jgi:para-nitrobenzyl esterase
MSVQTLLVLLACASLCVAEDPSLIRQTDLGRVQGVRSGPSNGWFGIPFAAPPVAELRFALPAAASPWAPTVRDATHQRVACSQALPALSPQTTSEDCLYLNVYAPPSTAATATTIAPLLPVMVWVHGGAFSQGGPQQYNGSMQASLGDVVVVTIAYRLGVFGFAAFPPSPAPAPQQRASPSVVPNAGLYDQRAALQWVQRNIHGFGGDASRVTVFGESAGGGSALYHLLGEESWPLLHRAVAESPGALWLPTRRRSENATLTYLRTIGCETLECARNLTTGQLLSRKVLPWGPTQAFLPCVDGEWFAGQPYRLLLDGRWKQAPLLIGWNAEEQNLFGAFDLAHKPPLSEVEYDAALAATFGNNSGDPNRLAPLVRTAYADMAIERGRWQAYARAVTDYCLLARCPDLLAPAFDSSPSPVFMYYFNYLPLAWVFKPLGCTHTAEIAFVFADGAVNGAIFDKADRAFARQVAGMWSDFAHGRSPLASWPDYRHSHLVHTLMPQPPPPSAFPYNASSCQRLASYVSAGQEYPFASVW